MQNSPVRAIVRVNNVSYVSYQQALIKQQILYRKTAHSLSKVVYAKALKQQKIKCLLIISIKQMR